MVVEYEGQRVLIAKGAPEEIQKICTNCETDEKISDFANVCQSMFNQKYMELSAQGYRVLAVAYKKVTDDKTHYSIGDETDMVFLGFCLSLIRLKKALKNLSVCWLEMG